MAGMCFARDFGLSVFLSLFAVAATAAPSLDLFVKNPLYESVLLSPDGKKIAVTVNEEGKRVLAFMTLDPMEFTFVLRFTRDEEVGDVFWANDKRVVVDVIKRLGWFDSPFSTGKLYGIDYNGRNGRSLFGYDSKEQQFAHATVISTLRDDKKNILISTHPWSPAGSGYQYRGDRTGEVLKLNIHSGRTVKQMSHPTRGGRAFATDYGDVHFAVGYNVDDEYTLYQRRNDSWEAIPCPKQCLQRPMGYSEDYQHVFLASNRDADIIGIERLNIASGERELIMRDERVDLDSIDWYPGTEDLMYAILEDGKPRYHFFDQAHSYTPFFRGLLKAFNGRRVTLHSVTPDGKLAVIRVTADNTPSDFYLANRESRGVSFLLSAAGWFQGQNLAQSEVIEVEARDGIRLQGYFTRPNVGKPPYPMVVLPHGGPMARDYWEYNRDVQVLAAQGYAVLQVNFRGSFGYGRGFQRASDLAWGTAVQDDITDSTRWSIEKGLADPKKICIYGISFGAYSALMSAIREPDLYQCTAGFAGVYDLELMYSAGDVPQTSMGRAYLEKALGQDREQLLAQSPLRQLDKLRVPLFIAHGGEDFRAPIEHAEAMIETAEKHKLPVSTHINRTGGHGFYTEKANKAYYMDLLAFLSDYLGD